jgi:hypothetical protein
MATAPRARKAVMPDLKPAEKRQLMGPEIGTEFDYGQRQFAYFGSGDVFDYGEWKSRDMSTMLVRDGQAAALEAVLTLPIRQAKWAVEPTHGDSGEAEFVHSVLAKPATVGGIETPFQQVIGQVTSAQIYKKAFFEKVYEIRPSDGKITYKKLAFRPTATCDIRRDAQTAGFKGFRQQVWMFGGLTQQAHRQQKVPGYVDIPKIRSFVYIHGKHRDPLQGVSEMDLCYWCYQTKIKLLFLWYNFLEAQSLPKVITYGQDQPEASSRADDIASMRQSGIVGWVRPADGSKSFDLLETSGKGADQFSAALSFLETWQTGSVLAGFTGLSSLASMGRGSMALSQDQSDFFLMSRQAVTMEMQTDITHQVVADLVRLNFGANASFPKFTFGPLVDENGNALVTLFQTMAVAPTLTVPPEIMDMITERLASVLQLDIDSVHKALKHAAEVRAKQAVAQAPPGMPPGSAAQLGALNGAVNAATSIAKQTTQARSGAQAGARTGLPSKAPVSMQSPRPSFPATSPGAVGALGP